MDKLKDCQMEFLNSKTIDGICVNYACRKTGLHTNILVGEDKHILETESFQERIKQAIWAGCKEHGCDMR